MKDTVAPSRVSGDIKHLASPSPSNKLKTAHVKMVTMLADISKEAVRSALRFLSVEDPNPSDITCNQELPPLVVNTGTLLIHHLKPVMLSTRRGPLSSGLLLPQDNTCPHTARATKPVLKRLHSEVLIHPPYSV